MLIRLYGIVLVCMCVAPSFAQPVGAAPANSDIQRITDRLDRLEKQNEELLSEIQDLRRQLGVQNGGLSAGTAAAPESTEPSPAERLDVQESRTAELAQSKLGTSQRMPVFLTGMLLFNAFHNGGYGGPLQVPVTAQLNDSPASTGASFRQTVIGLKFNGPDLPGGGKASGSAYFDFWGGTATPGNNLFRIRLATIDLTWKNTTFTAGQDKPIVSPREPMSLAQVGLAPLTGAGNLWDWQPQVRVEQRFQFSDQAGLRAQAGIYETAESYPATAPPSLSGTLERQRPGYQGRFLFYRYSTGKRLEIAPGFHFSTTHVAGRSVDSQLGTVDWLVQPSSFIEITGAMFRGMNAAGLGSLRQGFTIRPSGDVIPVHATGGWGQVALYPSNRLSVHIFGGEERDRPTDLVANNIRSNFVYAGNLVYKLAPNVLAAIEASQTRTNYISSGLRLNNHYDLALAYLF
jgi:hypothetical protein